MDHYLFCKLLFSDVGGSLAYNLVKIQREVNKSEDAYDARLRKLAKDFRVYKKSEEQKEKERALNLELLEKEFREYRKLQERKYGRLVLYIGGLACLYFACLVYNSFLVIGC